MWQAVLTGNPNVGKSTVFNALTGLRQHTGNWPGKTVETKTGLLRTRSAELTLTDLPGTYSLMGHSPEEVVAGDYLREHTADCVVVVCDATALSRNLILALQIRERFHRCVVCVNLIDEGEKRGIVVDTAALSTILGCPVIPCAARQKRGLDTLRQTILSVCAEKQTSAQPTYHAYGKDIPTQAEAIARTVCQVSETAFPRDTKLDHLLAGSWMAYPMMAALGIVVLWLTIRGAGYLSEALTLCFDWLLTHCMTWGTALGLPTMLCSFLVEGVLTTLTQVIAVMLPPMAIFFPLFTLLEDLGYLPRAAFCLDRAFHGCGACGKQALTMLMGLGCNAAGVTGCRIIDSPRERKLAILTNSLTPCNGRLPMVLSLTGAVVVLLSRTSTAPVGLQTVAVALVLALCTGMTLLICRVLSHTLLQGENTTFAMELPCYRIPQWGQVLVRSFLDRTLLVLRRAVVVAAPAGALLWCLTHMAWQGTTWYGHITVFLDSVGQCFGMDGVILTAFILSLPAAELFLPLVLLGYGASEIVLWQCWQGSTILCVLWFTLFHWPCATTLLTIQKETGSWGLTLLSATLPTAIGLAGCLLLRALPI